MGVSREVILRLCSQVCKDACSHVGLQRPAHLEVQLGKCSSVGTLDGPDLRSVSAVLRLSHLCMCSQPVAHRGCGSMASVGESCVCVCVCRIQPTSSLGWGPLQCLDHWTALVFSEKK